MEKGEFRFTGPTAELLDRPDILRSVFIEGAGPAVNAAGNGRRKKAPATAAVRRQVPPADAPVVLECQSVSKRFGGIVAVDNVDIELREGQILGLIGQNGARKTTLFDCVSGFHRVDGGRIRLDGVDVTEMRPDQRAALGLGRSFQEARLFPSLTTAETLALARERQLMSRSVLAAALGQPASSENEEDVAEKVDILIDLMGLEAFREKLTGELSTGTRRIVELACLLASDPSVVVLDEPSGGVAQKETEALGPLLQRCRPTPARRSSSSSTTCRCCHRSATRCTRSSWAPSSPKAPGRSPRAPRVVESYLGTDLAESTAAALAPAPSQARTQGAKAAPRRT